MEFVWHGPTAIGDMSQVVLAEKLGFTEAWFTDSHMLRSDVYATMAVAALQTKTIKLGTGVSVAGTRLAPVTAAAIASINRIAPGRTFLSLATGNTAWRTMGQTPPIKVADLEQYARVVRALIDGDEVDYTYNGQTAPIQFGMPDREFIDVEHRIPLYMTGAGPRTRALAGRIGDGVVDVQPRNAELALKVMEDVRAGADAIGRTLPESFRFTTGGTVIVLDKDEDLDSDRVRAAAGPAVMLRLHALYSIFSEGSGRLTAGGASPDNLPPFVKPVWDDYCALLADTPPERMHLRVNEGHNTYMHDDEWQFVTPETIRACTIVGAPEEVVERLRIYADAGVGAYWLNTLPGELGIGTMQRFAEHVMPAFA